MMELMARVRSALRRAGDDASAPPVYTLGSLMVDPGRHLVQVDGENVTLTVSTSESTASLKELDLRVRREDRI